VVGDILFTDPQVPRDVLVAPAEHKQKLDALEPFELVGVEPTGDEITECFGDEIRLGISTFAAADETGGGAAWSGVFKATAGVAWWLEWKSGPSALITERICQLMSCDGEQKTLESGPLFIVVGQAVEESQQGFLHNILGRGPIAQPALHKRQQSALESRYQLFPGLGFLGADTRDQEEIGRVGHGVIMCREGTWAKLADLSISLAEPRREDQRCGDDRRGGGELQLATVDAGGVLIEAEKQVAGDHQQTEHAGE